MCVETGKIRNEKRTPYKYRKGKVKISAATACVYGNCNNIEKLRETLNRERELEAEREEPIEKE